VRRAAWRRPEFQAVYTDVPDAGVQFLGLDVKDQRQLAQSCVDRVTAPPPSASGAESTCSRVPAGPRRTPEPP
jgi:hypothetical protein